MGKFDNLWDSSGKFTGNYWQFSVVSKNIYYMIGLAAFCCICFFEAWDSYWPEWYTFLFFIPAIAMWRLNYTHWKECKEGRSS